MTLPRKLKAWQGPRTTEQAAADLGINRRTYENWLQGRNRPQGLALAALKERLAESPNPSKRLNKTKP